MKLKTFEDWAYEKIPAHVDQNIGIYDTQQLTTCCAGCGCDVEANVEDKDTDVLCQDCLNNGWSLDNAGVAVLDRVSENIEWNFSDEMDEDSPNADKDIKQVEEDYGQLVKYVSGNMTETDGDFLIELKNGDQIKYYYKFHPFPPQEFKEKNQYITFTINGRKHKFDADEYLDYLENWSLPIYSAMKMYDDRFLEKSDKLQGLNDRTSMFERLKSFNDFK